MGSPSKENVGVKIQKFNPTLVHRHYILYTWDCVPTLFTLINTPVHVQGSADKSRLQQHIDEVDGA